MDDAISLANTRIDFSFKGRASHAAAAPHLGRSALDAVELMNVGVNYMREHMPSDARIHYAMIDAGGVAPNVVQAKATVRYAIRARDLPGMRALIDRVKKVAEGAALMTETNVSLQVVSAVSNLLGNTPLEQAMQSQFDRWDRRLLTPPIASMPRKFRRRCPPKTSPQPMPAPACRHAPTIRLCDFIVPHGTKGARDDRLDRRRRRELGGADGAGARGHARDRYAGAFLADHRARQIRTSQKGHGACRQGDGRCGRRCAARSKPDRARQGRPQGTHDATPYDCPLPAELAPPLQPRPATAPAAANASAQRLAARPWRRLHLSVYAVKLQ